MLSKQKKGYKIKRTAVAVGLSFVIVFSIPSVALLTPRPVHANILNIEVKNIPKKIDSIKKKILNLIKYSAVIALESALNKWLQRLAYESAIWIASGGKGQKPLVHTKPLKDFTKEVVDIAVGEFLDSVSTVYFGRTLCKPFDPLIEANIILSIKRSSTQSKPVCTFSDILNNFKEQEIVAGTGIKFSKLQGKKLLDTETYGKLVKNWFNASTNPLGQFITLRTIELSKKEESKDISVKERLFDKDLYKHKMSGNIGARIETPAGMNRDELKRRMEYAITEEYKSAYRSLYEFGPFYGAIRTFMVTLGSRLLSEHIKGFFKTEKKDEPGDSSGSRSAVYSNTSFKKAKESFKVVFLTPSFDRGGITDVTASLAACPSNPEQRAFNNCIIDNDFLSAIAREMRVKEAIDEGLLDPNKTFGFNSDGSEPFYTDGYPYKSLVVLRKYRIIPVTWELAALYIRDVSKENRTYSLGDIVNDFDNPDSPFYHLVDPNWVLKVPVFECRFEGSGPQKLQDDIEVVDTGQTDPDTGEKIIKEIAIIARADYCADDRSCIEEGPTGQCRKFGYCTKERDIWRFQGEQCKPQFATCRTLTTADGVNISYLTNTLQRCDSSQVGCQFYSAYKTLNGEWAEDVWDETANSSGSDGKLTFADIVNRSDLGDISYSRYFNSQLENCSSAEEGCNRFLEFTNFYSAPLGFAQTTESIYAYVQSTTTEDYARWGEIREVYMKKPPPYLYCPTDISDPARDPECDNYLQWCEPDEVGCSLYIPVNGDPPIPAVLSSGDYCNVECIGYDQYLELPTVFDSNSRQVDLIPETATSCKVEEVGCERFTNLDEVVQGGEGIEYFSYIRECILPDDPAVKIFYTWEGSDTTGYQLKTWRLKSEVDGSPAGTSCTIDPNNLDCRQFIDADGNTYSRLLSTVVFATDDCHPYRREVDSTVINGIKSLSASCSAAAVGCREYRGNSGNVVKIIVSDDFENATTSGWIGGILSQESVYVGGHSLDKTSNIYKDVTGLLQIGKSYTLSFWAKGKASGVLQVSLENSNGRSVQNINIDTEWNYYQVGPLYIHFAIDDSTQELFYFRGGIGAYLDNIILREITDSYYLVKDSWQTPAICDQPYIGAQLGCDAYRDQGGGEVALLGFSSLCSDDKVGCKVMIDTQNSASPYEEEFNIDNDDPNNPESYYDNVIIPADKLVYVVDDSDKYCSSQAAGCRLMGRAIEDRQTGEIKQFSDEFVIDNPDEYLADNNILCSFTGLYCQEYNLQDSGAVAYYIDPAERVCEYRTDLTSGQTGWYKKGVDEPCETNKVCSNDLAIYCTEDNDCDFSASGGTRGICINKEPEQPLSYDNSLYDGWVGLCSQDQNSCSQYIDPEGVKFCTNNQFVACQQDADCIDIPDINTGISSGLCLPHLTKQSYYYSENSVDTASCNGIVDRDAGCRLFNKVDGYPTAYTREAYSSSLSIDGSTPQSDPSFIYRNGREYYFNNDANTLLKVERDRVCDQWLYCQTKIEDTDEQGNKIDRCFAIGLCDGLNNNNQCNSFPPVKKVCSISGTACSNDFDCEGGAGDVCQVLEITGEQNKDINASSTWDYDPAQYSVEDLRMMSGYTKAGMRWTGFGPTRDGVIYGYYPYSKMYEIGGTAELVNGDFEEVNRDDGGQSGSTQIENYPFFGWRSDRGGNCLQSGGSSVCEVKEDRNIKISGKYSAKLSVSPASSGADLSNVRLVQSLNLPPGEYVLSGYVKWVGVRGWGVGEERPRVNIEVFWNHDTASVSLGGSVGGSNGWERFTLPFQNSTEDVNIRLILWQVETGTAWFDDVKIEPALKVADAPDDILIGQSCRMYPKGDSPACEYEKNAKSYRGWRGYCVEPDPNNANYCINWWPVDLIRGSSTEVGEESLSFNERAPLYYCLQSKGNEGSGVNFYGYEHNNYRYVVKGSVGEGRSGLIAFFNNDCNNNAGLGLCDIGPYYDIYNHSYYSCRSGAEYAIGGCSRGSGTRWRLIDLRDVYGNGTVFPETNLYEYEIEMVALDKVSTRGEYPDWVTLTRATRIDDLNTIAREFGTTVRDQVANLNGFVWGANCSYAHRDTDRPVDGICDNSSDWLKFAIIFDQQGHPRQYFIYMDDYSGSNSEAAAWQIIYYLRDPCMYLAKVSEVEGSGIKSYPYFTRVSESSGYTVSTLGYDYNTDYPPFGSIFINRDDYNFNINDPSTWDSRTENGTQPIYIEPFNPLTAADGVPTSKRGPNNRGGSPYSSQIGSSESSLCVGGAYGAHEDDRGNLCVGSTEEDSYRKTKMCYLGDADDSGTTDGQGYGVCVGSTDPDVDNAASTDLSFAVDRLRELYAKPLGIWHWEYEGNGNWRYRLVSDNGTVPYWDDTDLGTPPVVDNVKVNDKTGDIIITNGGGNVKLTFTSDANNNQLPLRRYEVDWGDSSRNTVYQGSFNERPSPGDPHVVFHTYQYESGNSQPCRSLNVGLGEGNCSVYYINTEVEDNWELVGTNSYNGRIIVQQ